MNTRHIENFVLLLIVWVLLMWPFDPHTGGVEVQDLLAGVVVAMLAAFLMRAALPEDVGFRIEPMRLVWLVAYAGVLAGYIVKANLDVAYRVLHPQMPIRPGIVKVKTTLKTPAAITVLANSITLTPGTLTINALEDGTLYVHWIYIRSEEAEEATQCIIGRFEWFLKRILE